MMIQRLLGSIRWRFQLWYGLFLALALGGFVVTIDRLQRAERYREIDAQLRMRAAALTSVIERGRPPGEHRPPPPPPPPGVPPPPWEEMGGRERDLRPGEGRVRMPPEVAALFQEPGGREFYYLIALRNGPAITRSAKAPLDLPQPGPGSPETRQRGAFREVILQPAPFDFVLVGCSTAEDEAVLGRRRFELAGAAAAVLAIGLLGGWWLATQALRPLGRIAAGAQEIAAGRLSQRLPEPPPGSELRPLVEVLNSSFARLEAAFAQQARFTSDAAHELRTPLAVMLTEAQSILRQPRTPEEYQQAFERCLRAGQRMRMLTEALLELARLEADEAEIAQRPFDLAEICTEALELLRPLARERQVTLAGELHTQEVMGDPVRISQVVVNLLTNSLQHSAPGGEVRLTLWSDQGDVCLTVEDDGPGIAPEHLPHIFERFYRGEAARTRRTGGAGLGLAITRAIVEAHHGEIRARSVVSKGTTMTVRLPEPRLAQAQVVG